MSTFAANTPADQIFEVDTIPLRGFKFILWWVGIFIAKIILYDLGPATRPQTVVVRYKHDGTIFYQEGKYIDAFSPASAVQVLTEELQTKTVEAFCKGRSLAMPDGLCNEHD